MGSAVVFLNLVDAGLLDNPAGEALLKSSPIVAKSPLTVARGRPNSSRSPNASPLASHNRMGTAMSDRLTQTYASILNVPIERLTDASSPANTPEWDSLATINITLAVDAMTDMNADAHVNSVTRIFPKLGETGTTQEIIDLLDKSKA